MKKNYFLGALLIVSSMGFSQNAIIVNGGQFGNPNENVKVQVYEPAIDSSRVIDIIQTGSVQEILFDGFYAVVAAQDSLIRYDLTLEKRVASASYNGVSTKSLAIIGNELLVGNFYGKSSDNLYIFDKNNLNLLDSISGLSKAVKSILVHSNMAYIPQNDQTSGFSDTLGSVVVVDIPNRTIVDTISIAGYTGEMGQIIERTSGQGFLTVNPNSNTITTADYGNFASATNTSFTNDLRVEARSHYSRHNDTLFLRMDNGIGAINSNNLSVIQTNIVDTVVTGFSYDNLNSKFYVTQTDFFSYNLGKEYDRAGNKTRDIDVGFSPEVVRMYYGATLDIKDNAKLNKALSVYPNPSEDVIHVDLSLLEIDRVQASLVNLKGQLVRTFDINKYQNTISLSGLNSGVYFLMLQSGSELYNARIIKK